jgi:hypothetical protein
MLRGSAIDRIVFGGTLIRCDISRGTGAWRCVESIATGSNVSLYPGPVARGKEYDSFVSRCPPGIPIELQSDWDKAFGVLQEPCDVASIVTSDEYETAHRAAAAVLSDSVVVSNGLLKGRYQVVAQWDAHGLPFAAGIEGERGGFDVLGADHVADLKATTTTEPWRWKLQAKRMLYHAQIACYDEGAKSIGNPVSSHWIVGVEFKPPHNVTCLRLTSRRLDIGRELVANWCEQLKTCESSGEWPGYSREPVEWDEDEGFLIEGDDDDGN